MRRLLLATSGVMLCAAQVPPQSLAEAARRSEEARKATGTTTLAFDMPDVPVPAIASSTSRAPAHTRALAATPSPEDGAIDLQPGAEIPDFRFVDFNGSSRNLSDFRGKYLMLAFWGSWCPYCRAEIPYAKDAYARFRSRGFEILGMDYERSASVEDVRAFLHDNGVTWTFARPDSVRSLITERFRIKSYPTIVLLDPESRVMPVPRSALRGKTLAATLDRILPR